MGSINTKTFQELVAELPESKSVTPTSQRTLSASLDPRSPPPCELVTRTPIQVVKTPDVLGDPRSPTAGIVRTPIRGSNAPVSDAASGGEEAVTDSPDCLFNKAVDDSSKLDIKSKLITDSPTRTPSTAREVCAIKVSRPKTLFTSAAPLNPPRSPLGCRNVAVSDSPRSMVQRKQVDKLRVAASRKRNGQRYNECDKENVISPLART